MTIKSVESVASDAKSSGKFWRFGINDYYDATPGAVEVTPEERERIRIPVYKMLI